MQGDHDGTQEGKRRPNWRDKPRQRSDGGEALPAQGNMQAGNSSSQASQPPRRPRQQQHAETAAEQQQGEHSTHAAEGSRKAKGRAPRAERAAQGPGPAAPPAPPPGLSIRPASTEAQPHSYRIGQAQAAATAAAADAAAAGASARRTADRGGSATDRQPQQAGSKGSRGGRRQQPAGSGSGGEALPGFQPGGLLSAEMHNGPAARSQPRGQASSRGAGTGRGRGQRSNGPGATEPAPPASNNKAFGGRGQRGRGSGPAPSAGRPPQRAPQRAPLRLGAGPPQQQGQRAAPQAQQAQQEQGGRGRRPIFAPHLGSAELQRGLKSGFLFRALFRCNAADRTQGFCSVPGLPTDVFIRGYKSQNRAMEGDEVIIRILPPEQWYTIFSKQAQQEQQAQQAGQARQGRQQAAVKGGAAAAVGQTAAAAAGPVAGNVVPARGLLQGATAAAQQAPAAEPVAAEVAVGSPPPMTPPIWAGAAAPPLGGMGDLVASPALRPSASGGELTFAVGPNPLKGLEGEESESEEGSSVEEGLSDEEKERVLEELEDSMQGMALQPLEKAASKGGESPSSTSGSGSGSGGSSGSGDGSGNGAIGQGAEEQQGEGVSAPAGAAQQPAAASAAAEGDGGGASMLDFVLSQPGTSTAGAATSAAAAGGAAPPPPHPAAGECWHAANTPEEGLKLVAERLAAANGAVRATGEVVAVVQPSRRRESVIGVLKQEGDTDNGVLLLVPCDPRLPRMLVRSSQLPAPIKQALKTEAACAELSSRTLVSAHVAGWEPNHMFPLAQVRDSLGQAGELATETKALLEMEQVKDDDQFTPAVLSCLPPTPWSISEAELASRRDFRSARVFSIDPPTARDLDDALSVVDLGGGLYRVGVHIADVSHFVLPDTALDKEAQQRSTSVYLVDRVIPMLPRLLCEELCSLNPGVDRLSFSIEWEITEEGDIQSTWVGRSVIRSCGKLAYPMVQSMIEGEFLAQPGQEPPCELHGPHTWPEVVGDSLALNRIARNLRRRRFENGALRLDNVRLYFKLDEEGNPEGYGVYEQKEANQLVEEFMLLANMTAAKMVADAFPDRALLRCHPPPNQHKMLELAGVAKELGFTLDVSSAGALQESLSVLREAAGGDAIIDIITLLATKPMQVARYFCTGETPDDTYWRHYALAVAHYTHFTSPIRRYPDIIVHRLLAAAIDAAGGSPEARAGRHGLLETREVGMVGAHSNDRKLAAKSVQDGSLRLYLCVMLHRQPLICDGVVMAVGGSRFFDVYVPALGVDVRMHTNSVLKGGDGALDSQWDPQAKVLTLSRTAADPVSDSEAFLLPDYSDIPNFDRVTNPANVPPAALPLTIRMLAHVPLVVSSRRSQTSGSPTHVTAKLWVE